MVDVHGELYLYDYAESIDCLMHISSTADDINRVRTRDVD